jgi:hypothetical protein
MVEVVVDCVVMVLLETPLQRHAEKYLAVPEQAEAYFGTAVGILTLGQADITSRWSSSTSEFRCGRLLGCWSRFFAKIVLVAVTVS